MRYLLSFVIIVHGLIHFMGFAKAFGYGTITQITKTISKPIGALWLVAALLFIVTVVLFLLKNDFWWLVAVIAAVLSQLLIITVWHDAKFGTIANVIVLLCAISVFFAYQFKGNFRSDYKSLINESAATSNEILSEEDMTHLPDAVKKYLRYTGSVGKPKVENFKVCFKGKIRKNNETGWMPLVSEQYNFMETPTRLFFMDAVMKQLPVAGYHCYKNGDAFMDIRLLSMIKVQYQTGSEMSIAETVTFFNDMCCMAPATLIDKRIKWITTEGNAIQAEFTTNNITISATLYFNDKGELINFISNDRYAQQDDGGMKQLRWSTPLKNYKEINGYKLAGSAETVYNYPEGDLVYGIFNLTEVEYNCKK